MIEYFTMSGNVTDNSGIANITRRFLSLLLRRNVSVKLFPVWRNLLTTAIVDDPVCCTIDERGIVFSRRRSITQPHLGNFRAPLAKTIYEEIYRTDLLIHGAPCPSWDFELASRFDRNIGCYYWEASPIPSQQQRILQCMDEIWAGSQYVADMVKEHYRGPVRVSHFRHSLAPEWFSPRQRTERETFRFLAVSAYIPRKGFDLLFNAFARAFEPKDNVELFVKVNPGEGCRVERYLDIVIGDAKKRARVKVIERFMSEEEIIALYDYCDAFALPSRGEGFGMPFLQAMARGLPTIGTTETGTGEFMRSNNCFPVECCDPPAILAGSPVFYRQCRFLRPSVDHLIERLREVRKRLQATVRVAERGRKFVAARYNEEKVLKDFAKLYPESPGSAARTPMETTDRYETKEHLSQMAEREFPGRFSQLRHEIAQFEELLPYNAFERVFIYGSGFVGQEIFKWIGCYTKVRGFVDSFAEKAGGREFGLPVVHCDKLASHKPTLVLIGSLSSSSKDAILDNLTAATIGAGLRFRPECSFFAVSFCPLQVSLIGGTARYVLMPNKGSAK